MLLAEYVPQMSQFDYLDRGEQALLRGFRDGEEAPPVPIILSQPDSVLIETIKKMALFEKIVPEFHSLFIVIPDPYKPDQRVKITPKQAIEAVKNFAHANKAEQHLLMNVDIYATMAANKQPEFASDDDDPLGQVFDAIMSGEPVSVLLQNNPKVQPHLPALVRAFGKKAFSGDAAGHLTPPKTPKSKFPFGGKKSKPPGTDFVLPSASQWAASYQQWLAKSGAKNSPSSQQQFIQDELYQQSLLGSACAGVVKNGQCIPSAADQSAYQALLNQGLMQNTAMPSGGIDISQPSWNVPTGFPGPVSADQPLDPSCVCGSTCFCDTEHPQCCDFHNPYDHAVLKKVRRRHARGLGDLMNGSMSWIIGGAVLLVWLMSRKVR